MELTEFTTFGGRTFHYDPKSASLFYVKNNKEIIPVTGDRLAGKLNLDIDMECSKVRNQTSKHTHKNVRFKNPTNLRIFLGGYCNFRCKYCSQEHTEKELITPDKLKDFMKSLDAHLDMSSLNLVQFWGGEPLMYWDAICYLMDAFMERLPRIGFSMVTNGSRMNETIAKRILSMDNFGLILSHDGPGQHLRTISEATDALRNKRLKSLFLTIAKEKCAHGDKRTFANEGRNFAVNPVLTVANNNLPELVAWYDETFGVEVPIAECIPLIPTSTEMMALTPFDIGDVYFSEGVLLYSAAKYARMIYNTFTTMPLERFDNYNLQYKLFLAKVLSPDFQVNSTKASCFTTDPYVLTLDIDGNILPCQTYHNRRCGNINVPVKKSDERILDGLVELPVLNNWKKRSECHNCPALPFCMGGCPYLSEDAHEIDCKIKLTHYHGLVCVYLDKIADMLDCPDKE